MTAPTQPIYGNACIVAALRADHVLLCHWPTGLSIMSPLELAALEAQALAFQALVERVRSEFLEMPGLRLTMPQAARLWGLDGRSCEAVVESLIRSAFLRRTASGAVARVDG